MIVVVGATVLAAEVKLPAMKTRLRVGTTSMSQISPLLIRGVLARGLSGARWVCPGRTSPPMPVPVPVPPPTVGVAACVTVSEARPWSSVTTREMVLAPLVVYVCVVVSPVPVVPSPKSQA